METRPCLRTDLGERWCCVLWAGHGGPCQRDEAAVLNAVREAEEELARARQDAGLPVARNRRQRRARR